MSIFPTPSPPLLANPDGDPDGPMGAVQRGGGCPGVPQHLWLTMPPRNALII